MLSLTTSVTDIEKVVVTTENIIILRMINLRAKRGGSLFEAGSEREENGGVASVQKWCA